jgi:hypothetical protein
MKSSDDDYYAKQAARILLAGVALAFLGCGDGRPARVPVSGQVLIDGKPLTYGSVQFIPDNARAAQGKLDGQGRFTLSCFEANDGAVVGLNRVAVNACEHIGGVKMRWHAPKKYADAKSSGLSQNVTEATESLAINLTWDGGKPFVEVAEGEGGREPEEKVRFGSGRTKTGPE